METLILKFIEKNNEINCNHRSGDVIKRRGDKVRQKELPSKTDADVPLFEEISVRFNALAYMAKF